MTGLGAGWWGELHSKEAEGGGRDGGVSRGFDAQGDDATCVDGVDDAVIPESGGGVIGIGLLFVFCEGWGFEFRLLFGGHGLASECKLIHFDREEDIGGLFAAHDGNAGVWPHPELAWAEGASAHAVVSGTVAAADDDSKFGDVCSADGGDKFCAVFSDALVFVLSADHEAGDVLKKEDGDLSLATEFDEMSTFEGGF